MAGKKKKKKHREEENSILPSKLFESIRNLHFLYHKKLEKAFAAFGLSAEQFRILHILQEAPSEGLPLHTVRKTLPNQTANATRLVGKLVVKGMLLKKTSSADKREVRIKLTVEGKKVIEDVLIKINKIDASVTSNLKNKNVRELVESIAVLTKALS